MIILQEDNLMHPFTPYTIDPAYYAGRRDKAILLARAARDPNIRVIHERMAARYGELAQGQK
jgi:hypothetical protein